MAGLDDRHVRRAKKLVLEKFPEMAGAEPSVSKKGYQSKGSGGRGRARGADDSERYVLIFEKDISLPQGRHLKRRVRVTMDGSGEVIKLTSSK